VFPALAFGFGLFLCGVLFAYLKVLPSVLEFFYTYGESMGIASRRSRQVRMSTRDLRDDSMLIASLST
jgi:Sec-independent protein secretion pathway component TatC